MFNQDSSPEISYCRFSNNQTEIVGGGVGGGIYFYSGTASLTNSTIEENTATQHGGGIFCNSSSLEIENNCIQENYAQHDGGGVYFLSSDATFSNNVVVNNASYANGGGVHCMDSSPMFSNNAIIENTAEVYSGAGIYCSNSSPTIINSTVWKNTATVNGGGIFCGNNSSPVITNTIFWINVAPADPEIHQDSSSDPMVSYCDVTGGWTGTGNFDSDPLFVDPVNNDFHIPLNSPCWGAGYNIAPDLPDTDFEGDPRLTGFLVDIGADEVHTHLYIIGDVIPGSTIDIKVVGRPWFLATLALGANLRIPPLSTNHGFLYLKFPLIGQWPIGNIQSNGVLTKPVAVPVSWGSGDTYYLQALIGPWGGPWTELTNAEMLVVE